MTEQDLDKKIENALGAEAAFQLPSNFAQRVVMMVEAKQIAAAPARDGWWLAAGIAAMIGAFVYVIVTLDFKPGFGSFEFLSRHAGLVVFGVVFIALLNIVDRLMRRGKAFNSLNGKS